MSTSLISRFANGSALSPPSRVDLDFKNLLARMRQRAYPETVPALAYFWLRTLYISAYDRGEWNQMDARLRHALETGIIPEHAAILADIRERIREDGLLSGDAPLPRALEEADRTAPTSRVLAPYFIRLLNEWLPKEIARLMIEESAEEGISALAVGRALERLLSRQCLSRAGLETALDPSRFSPRFVYAEHYEILRDVALFLLRRTAPPAPYTGPATLLSSAPDAKLFDDFADTVARAEAAGDLLEIPVTTAQGRALLGGNGFHIASIVVTLDGRWWQAFKLRGGENYAIVYRPAGRLQIDFSGEQVRLSVPWLERRAFWSGCAHLPVLQLFGREWHAIEWDQDADHTWLQLASTAPLPLDRIAPDADTGVRRCRPAFVDMGWTALENALSAASADSIERLRHEELIPLGRALIALTQVSLSRRDFTPENVEARLLAVAFNASALEPVYGKVPWQVLPPRLRNRLLDSRVHPFYEDRLRAVFDEVPAVAPVPRLLGWLPISPKRAA